MPSDLLEAAKNGYYNKVLSLLAIGSEDVNVRDKDRATPLYWSASRGHLDICRALLEHPGCDVNAVVKWGSTALHAAADRGHKDCLKLLIDSGAEVNVQNERGDTPMHLAAYRGFRDIVQDLVDAWADPFAKNSQSKTPLQEAQSQQHSGAAAVLQTYMESLGYRPFVSLPATAQSEMVETLQENAGHNVKSWPTYRNYPRYPATEGTPATTTPTSTHSTPKAHTYPIKMNNLSETRPTRSQSAIVQNSSGTRTGVVGGMVGCAPGLDDVNGGHRDGFPAISVPATQTIQAMGHRRHYPHSEPTESVDEFYENDDNVYGYNHAATAVRADIVDGHLNGGGRRTQHTGFNDDTATDLLLSTVPPCSQAPGYFRTNGYTGVIPSRPARLGLTVPPPTPPEQDGFLNKEDLAMFAESLQMEVVRLRDNLTQKEKEVCDLQGMVSSLERQNASLQQELLAKQHALADVVAVKDRELSDLRRRIGAVEKQNANLHQALVAKQQASEEMFTMREGDLSEMSRKINTLEKLNAGLEQVIVNKQEVLKSTLASKDMEMFELRQRLVALEKQVGGSRRPGASSTGWNPDFDRTGSMFGDLTPRAASHVLNDSGCFVEHQLQSRVSGPLGSTSRAQTRVSGSTNQTGRTETTASGCVTQTSHAQTRISGSVTQTSPPAVSHSPRVSDSPKTRSDDVSIIPSGACKAGASAPALQAPEGKLASSESPKLRSSAQLSESKTTSSDYQGLSTLKSGVFSPALRPSEHGKSFADSQELKSLKTRLAALYPEDLDQCKLDADGREWAVDRDFTLLDDKPVNCQADGQRKGSCSLVFRIKHKQRRYVLKMLTNLINLHYDAHSLGRSLDAHLLQSFGAEFHAPLLLHAHPNIVRVRHHYQGDTTRFQNYLSLLVPSTLDVPIEMARRTTFLVMDEYPLTLQSLVACVREDNFEGIKGGNAALANNSGKAPSARISKAGNSSITFANSADTVTNKNNGGDAPVLPEQFVVHLLYQLLSAVEYLQRHHVVHRDIKADNVFMDWRLRPVLGDFGFARTVCGYQGETIPFTDRTQVYAGNPHAWAPELSRLNKNGLECLPRQKTLEQVYAKSDEFAVGRMFYSLLRPVWEDEHSDCFPVSSQTSPHYQDADIPTLEHVSVSASLRHVLKQLVLDDPERRPSIQRAVTSAGVLLCRPKPREVTSLGAAEVFCKARLHKLAEDCSTTRPSQPEEGTLSIEESVTANENQLEASFLSSLSCKDFWDTLSDFQQHGLL